jgi:hypothetical protein
MKYNPNKAVTAKQHGITVSYTDTLKHYNIMYQKKGLETKQLYAAKTIAQKQYDRSKQTMLLNDAIYGLSLYTDAEIAQMPKNKKYAILSVYKKAFKSINTFKNERMRSKLNYFLTTVFFKSHLAKDIAAFEDEEELHGVNNMSFHELGITMEMLVERLIQDKVFPPDYKNLV